MIIILVCKIFSPFYDNLCFVSNSLALWPAISPTHQSNNINHLLLDQTITFSIETVWFVSWYHTKTAGICGVFIKCQYHWSWPALNPFYLNTIYLISDTRLWLFNLSMLLCRLFSTQHALATNHICTLLLTEGLNLLCMLHPQWSYYRIAKFKSAESPLCNTSATSKASKGRWWKFEPCDTHATSKAN